MGDAAASPHTIQTHDLAVYKCWPHIKPFSPHTHTEPYAYVLFSKSVPGCPHSFWR